MNGMWKFAVADLRREATERIEIGSGESLNRRLWRDLSELSLPSLLHWEDRNSMSAGTEARLPFLDHRLVEAVLSTSVNTKLKCGFTKYSLRRAMEERLPPAICWQKKKRGFETPARHWFKTDLAGQVEGLLSRKDSPLAELFDIRALRRQFKAFQSTNHDTLTEYDWFRLVGTTIWLDQLRSSSVRAGLEPIMAVQ